MKRRCNYSHNQHKTHTLGVILSIWVRRLKVRVEPTADPCLLPTRTRMASAGRRKRLVNSTFRWRVDLGGIVTWSPLGTAKSLASWPATKTWYCSGLPLGLLSFTCRKIKRKLSYQIKLGGNMVTELILWFISDFTLFLWISRSLKG